MFGPKLDSRSYTTLLLVVIAVLLSLNLFAQMRTRDQGGSIQNQAYDLKSTDSEAGVAEATAKVADANREIATALQSVASAIQGLKLNVDVHTDGSNNPAPTAPAAATEGGAVDNSGNESIKYEGKINL